MFKYLSKREKTLISISFVIGFIGFTIALLLSGCQKDPKVINFIKEISQPHEIRKMFNIRDRESYASGSGGFFLFFGGASYNSSSKIIDKVQFAWKYKNKYILDTVYLSTIEIILDKDIKTPVVQFKWCASFPIDPDKYTLAHLNYGELQAYDYTNHIQTFLSYYRCGTIIRCHPDDWKININLPLNKKRDKE